MELITFQTPTSLLKKVDEARGWAPRSAFLRDLLSESFASEKTKSHLRKEKAASGLNGPSTTIGVYLESDDIEVLDKERGLESRSNYLRRAIAMAMEG